MQAAPVCVETLSERELTWSARKIKRVGRLVSRRTHAPRKRLPCAWKPRRHYLKGLRPSFLERGGCQPWDLSLRAVQRAQESARPQPASTGCRLVCPREAKLRRVHTRVGPIRGWCGALGGTPQDPGMGSNLLTSRTNSLALLSWSHKRSPPRLAGRIPEACLFEPVRARLGWPCGTNQIL
jgi:hypothetical protein